MVSIIPYNRHTQQRIAERNARSEEFLRDKSSAYRAVARTGLAFSNTVDRVNALFRDQHVNATSGALIGGGGGAIVGLGLGIVATVATGGAGAFLLPWIMGGTALLGAGIESRRGWKESVEGGGKRRGAAFADELNQTIGGEAGSVPEDPSLSHKEVLTKLGRDPDLLEKAEEFTRTGRVPELMPAETATEVATPHLRGKPSSAKRPSRTPPPTR